MRNGSKCKSALMSPNCIWNKIKPITFNSFAKHTFRSVGPTSISFTSALITAYCVSEFKLNLKYQVYYYLIVSFRLRTDFMNWPSGQLYSITESTIGLVSKWDRTIIGNSWPLRLRGEGKTSQETGTHFKSFWGDGTHAPYTQIEVKK